MTEESRKLLNPKRLEGESREEYQKRRKAVAKALKQYLKGRTVWNPNLPIPYEGKNYIAGPYIKEVHGPLLSGLNLEITQDGSQEQPVTNDGKSGESTRVGEAV